MKKMNAIHVLAAVSFASLVWGFNKMFFVHAPAAFNYVKGDMSYAWYVPLFSLYVIWRERDRFVKSFSSPSVAGALLTLPFLAAGLIGVRGLQVRLEMLAVVGLLVALSWAFFGFKTAKLALFPAGFLLFCLPLSTVLDVITIHLRLFATSIACGALEGFGAEIVRRGTMLSALDGSFSIDIADPCSGLRSLFALMALTLAYAYFSQPTWPRRAALFALSVPIAVAGNVMRILSICLVGKYASGEFATGFYHDYSGYVIFFAGIILMVACGESISALSRRFFATRSSGDSQGELLPRGARRTGKRDLAIAVTVTAVTVSSMAFFAVVPEPVLAETPAARLGAIDGFADEAHPPAESEVELLPEDTIIDKRMYTAPAGDWHLVTMVIGGRSKASIHRPELCLSGQGFLMASPRTEKTGDVKWRLITLRNACGAADQGFAYTFFNQAGYHTPSHTARVLRDSLDRLFYNRIDRWAMVTVHSASDDFDARAKFLEKLSEAIK